MQDHVVIYYDNQPLIVVDVSGFQQPVNMDQVLDRYSEYADISRSRISGKWINKLVLPAINDLPLQVKVDFTPGSREVDVLVKDTSTGIVLFHGGGFYESSEGEWLAIDIHDKTLIAQARPDMFEDDQERLAKSLVEALVELNGETFANAEDLLDHFGFQESAVNG